MLLVGFDGGCQSRFMCILIDHYAQVLIQTTLHMINGQQYTSNWWTKHRKLLTVHD